MVVEYSFFPMEMQHFVSLSVNRQSASLHSIAPRTQLRKEDARLSTLDCADVKWQRKINNDIFQCSDYPLLVASKRKAVQNGLLLSFNHRSKS